MEKDEVEELLVGLILEGRVEGRIDQTTMRLELADRQCVFWRKCTSMMTFLDSQSLEKRRYAALDKWTEALENVHSAITGKIAPSGRGGASDIGMAFGLGPFAEMERAW